MATEILKIKYKAQKQNWDQSTN